MYDPKQAYYNRMTPATKVGLRRNNHQFRDSLGGCSSNYNDLSSSKGEKYSDKF